jgi:hypothetical protein
VDHQQRAVQRLVGDGVRRFELPARKMGLHDLEAVRDPVDGVQQTLRACAGRGCATEVQDDLGLDLRLDEPPEPTLRTRLLQVDDGRIVDVRPDRLTDAEGRPHGGVGEADLAANRLATLCHPRAMNQARHRLGRCEIEARHARREALEVARRVLGGFHLAGERLQVWHSGHGRATRLQRSQTT